MVQGVCSPLVGSLTDRFGPRPVLVAGVLLLGASSILTGTVSAPWHLYLHTGLIGALGMVSLGWVPTGVLLARAYAERRGRVVGIAFSGMGVGVFLIGPLAQWLITWLGWRAATMALGAGAVALLLPLVLLGTRAQGPRQAARAAGAGASVVEAPSGPGEARAGGRLTRREGAAPPAGDPTLGDALRARAFWALFAAYFLTPVAVFPVATHSVAFAVDRGFSPMAAAWAYGVMGLMSTVGRAVFGIASDRVGGPLSATLSFACSAGGALALLALDVLAPSAFWLALFAVLFGLGFGARGPIIAAMASERFGGRRFGLIWGALNVANGLGGAVGPWYGGAVHDVTGSYRVAFLSAVAVCAIASACFWAARSRTP